MLVNIVILFAILKLARILNNKPPIAPYGNSPPIFLAVGRIY